MFLGSQGAKHLRLYCVGNVPELLHNGVRLGHELETISAPVFTVLITPDQLRIFQQVDLPCQRNRPDFKDFGQINLAAVFIVGQMHQGSPLGMRQADVFRFLVKALTNDVADFVTQKTEFRMNE